MRKQHKGPDGKYHIHGKVYTHLVGSRAMVYHGTAYKTSGGLIKKDLYYNQKRNRIVSRRKHETAKREKRLEKHGYFAQKGKFGAVKRTPQKSARKSRKSRKSRSRRHTS